MTDQQSTPGEPATKRNSFLLPRGKSLKQFFENNWLNVIVLLFALGVSAAATAVSYSYANESIDSLSIQLRSTVLLNIQNQIDAYLEESIAIIPVCKSFLQDRSIDTGIVKDPDFQKSVYIMGKLFLNSPITTSLFFVDPFLNNIGWGQSGGMNLVLMVWQGYGSNFYIPVNGTIANVSQPVAHQEGIAPFPLLETVRKAGKPYWGDPYFLQTGPADFNLLLPYVEPGYFDDNGQFLGVVGSNVKIDVWESVLNGYKIGETGKVFITNNNGQLLADSNIGIQKNIETVSGVIGGAVLPNATDNNDPLLAAAAKYLLDEYKSFGDIPSANQLKQFEYNDEVILVLVGQFSRGNLNVITVIVVPQSDFTASIDKARVLTIGLTVAASVMGALNYMPWGTFYRKLKKQRNKNKVTLVTPAKLNQVSVSNY